MALAWRIRSELDARQIRLERHSAVVLLRSAGSGKQGTGKQNRSRVQLLVLRGVGARSWPDWLIGDTVELDIGIETTTDRNQPERGGKGGVKAEVLVASGAGWVTSAGGSASASFRAHRVAVLEMSDFVGKSCVVRMSRPRHSSVLAGGSVHGVKVGWKVVLF